MSDAEVDDAAAVPPDRHDWFLENLVSLANRDAGEFPITLVVGGILITGYIASGAEYHRTFAARIAKTYGVNAELEAKIRQNFESYADIYDESTGAELRVAFIHLKDAQYLTPGTASFSPTDGKGNWWRGRLSEVSGFHYGKLEESNE